MFRSTLRERANPYLEIIDFQLAPRKTKYPLAAPHHRFHQNIPLMLFNLNGFKRSEKVKIASFTKKMCQNMFILSYPVNPLTTLLRFILGLTPRLGTLSYVMNVQ